MVSVGFDVVSLQFLSGEDARRRGGLITSIRRARRLNQHDVHFPASHGPMFNTLGHDKHLAEVERDGAIPQLDVERTLEHKEKIVRLVMFVPVKRSSSLATMMSLLL